MSITVDKQVSPRERLKLTSGLPHEAAALSCGAYPPVGPSRGAALGLRWRTLTVLLLVGIHTTLSPAVVILSVHVYSRNTGESVLADGC